jgi:hypothetical protein
MQSIQMFDIVKRKGELKDSGSWIITMMDTCVNGCSLVLRSLETFKIIVVDINDVIPIGPGIVDALTSNDVELRNRCRNWLATNRLLEMYSGKSVPQENPKKKSGPLSLQSRSFRGRLKDLLNIVEKNQNAALLVRSLIADVDSGLYIDSIKRG